MRIRHTKQPLPKLWAHWARRYHIHGELDVRLRRRSRLACKVLMFETQRDMAKFWLERLTPNDPIGNRCPGVCSKFAVEIITFHKGGGESSRIEVDPRYFAVIGLVRGRADFEIISHEATHAAFGYAKRVHAKDMWHGAKELDEENVCYPVGRLTQAIVEWCHRHDFFSRPASKKQPLAKKRQRK